MQHKEGDVLVFDVLFWTGLAVAVGSLGLLTVVAVGELAWRRDERRCERELNAMLEAERDRQERAFVESCKEEARLMELFVAQLQEIKALPIANPWEVA